MKNRTFMVAAMLIGALALVATGCGSKKGKYSASKAEFAAAMNSVCVTINNKLAGIGITGISDLAGQKGVDYQKAVEDALVSVDKLGSAPDEIKDAVTDFVKLQKEDLDSFKKVIDAAKAGNDAEAITLAKALDSNDTQLDADANTIGAPACRSGSS